MSNAASFMGDYIHCIQLDRFVGYDNEADLEREASRLAGKNNLLAGKLLISSNCTYSLKLFSFYQIFTDFIHLVLKAITWMKNCIWRKYHQVR